MKLNQLIAHCINFITQDETEKNNENLQILKQSANYSSFVNNGLAEINRAIQEITPFKKYRVKYLNVEIENPNSNKSKIVIDDFLDFDVVYEVYSANFVDSETFEKQVCQYQVLGNDKIAITNPRRACTLEVIYYPNIRALTETDLGDIEYGENSGDNSIDLKELGISDQMCIAVIPYLVKAVMWQEIEPELAQLSRNTGIQNLSFIADGAKGIESPQNQVLLEAEYY